MKAHEILNAAAGHLADRAKTYDKPEGERSMAATVEAFKAVTGVSITETQGWLFMALLKAVRSQQNAFKLDSYEDGAAYFALAGESAAKVALGKAPDELAVDANAPDWENAPDWAQWVAQDKDGLWYWLSGKPEPLKDQWSVDTSDRIGVSVQTNPNPNWRNTLEQRPSNDGWIEWHGGECPVDHDACVEVKLKDGYGTMFRANRLIWHHRGTVSDIIAYRIVK